MSQPMRDWLQAFVKAPDFLGKYPCYASVLARMIPVEAPYVEVMAVSLHQRSFYLHVNVDFFVSNENFRYLRGVLLHEVHHVVLGHLDGERFQDLSERDLLELAMELSANEYIREPLPGQPPIIRDYASLGIAPGQSTRERYELLRQARQQGQAIAFAKPIDDHLLGGVAQAAAKSQGQTAVAQLLDEVVREAEDRQQSGSQPGGLLAGQEPGRLLEALEDREPLENLLEWKNALALFVSRLRRPRFVYHRPNRRFPQLLGVVPGRIRYPQVAECQRLLIAIDTSASMSHEELNEIARELKTLSRLADLTVVECDTIIQRIYPFEGRLQDVLGRGGTDLRPVFAEDFLRQHPCDGVVYFTDGEGPYLEKDPGVKTLWVLTKRTPFPCSWGQKALLRHGIPELPLLGQGNSKPG